MQAKVLQVYIHKNEYLIFHVFFSRILLHFLLFRHSNSNKRKKLWAWVGALRLPHWLHLRLVQPAVTQLQQTTITAILVITGVRAVLRQQPRAGIKLSRITRPRPRWLRQPQSQCSAHPWEEDRHQATALIERQWQRFQP